MTLGRVLAATEQSGPGAARVVISFPDRENEAIKDDRFIRHWRRRYDAELPDAPAVPEEVLPQPEDSAVPVGSGVEAGTDPEQRRESGTDFR